MFDKVHERFARVTGLHNANVHNIVKPKINEYVQAYDQAIRKFSKSGELRPQWGSVIDSYSDEPLTENEMQSWTLAFFMYVRLEADLYGIRNVKSGLSRCGLGPYTVRYFLRFLNRAGIEMRVEDYYLPPEQVKNLFTLGPKIEAFDFRPTVYLATHTTKRKSYIGLLNKTPANVKTNEREGNVVAGCHIGEFDKTRYTHVFDISDGPGVRREVTVAQQLTGTDAYEMETIVMLASLFANKLFGSPSVVNARTSTCSFTHISFFEEFRRTLFHLTGKTIKFDTSRSKPIVFCMPVFNGTGFEIRKN